MELLVTIACFFLGVIGFVVYQAFGSKKRRKEMYEQGHKDGKAIAESCGEAKAIKIANNLPRGTYHDGFVVGIWESEKK